MMLSEIIERLEKAAGPDRDLDAEIVAYLNNASMLRYPPTDDFGPRNKWQFWSKDGKHFLGNESRFPVPELTASLDAARALVERELPGAFWSLNSDHEAAVSGFEASGSTPAIALVIALLRTLSAKDGDDGR